MTAPPWTEVLEATWPPARSHRAGPWLLRDGQGGGKRVSAATAEGRWSVADLARAEAEMASMGQDPLFLIREGEVGLDQALEAQGYRIIDPVVAYSVPVAALAEPAPDPMAAFVHWPPLAICAELWAEAGIGPARLSVMERATGPKAVILGRSADRPAGAAYVALHKGVAMLHALEVLPMARRQGVARTLLRAAAGWAAEQGADRFDLVVTRANDPARALYASLGFEAVGQYHYRLKTVGAGSGDKAPGA